MKKISKENLAYIAGFLDGEGCIGFVKGGGGIYQPKITIVNTDKPVLEFRHLPKTIHENNLILDIKNLNFKGIHP